MKKSVFIIVLIYLFALSLSAADMLIKVSEESEHCPDGGAKIETGEDKNENQTLDQIEVTATQYVCNGADGSISGISISEEPAGGMCGSLGGLKISAGSGESFVCNGEPGKSALSKVYPDSVHCPNGGVRIEAGVDKDGDGTLDAEEVDATAYACNGAAGADGKDSLTKVSEEPKGDHCVNSNGVKIETGLDNNRNGQLDENEVKNTEYVCNGKNASVVGSDGPKGDPGKPGADGADGKDGEQGEKGEQGPKGEQGAQGETGATGEAGKNGAISLVSVVDEPKGENCVSGGKKIEVGLDANGNGALDEEEINPESVYYVCNGLDAEEAGLTSSSTGCSVSGIDETGEVSSVFLAMILMFFAFVAVRLARS